MFAAVTRGSVVGRRPARRRGSSRSCASSSPAVRSTTPAGSPPTCRWRRGCIMVKADGSVLVHADGGSYKPLNWMSPPARCARAVTDDGAVEWTVEARRRRHPADPASRRSSATPATTSAWTPGLQKDGVEKHLQELLADHPATLGDGLTLVRREYPTAIGPVDLLCRDADGATVAVEVKRRGDIDGVEQLTRYLELLNRDPLLGARCAASSPPRRSSRRPGCSPPTGASPAWSSTTTPYAAWTNPTTCFLRELHQLRDLVRAPPRQRHTRSTVPVAVHAPLPRRRGDRLQPH